MRYSGRVVRLRFEGEVVYEVVDGGGGEKFVCVKGSRLCLGGCEFIMVVLCRRSMYGREEVVVVG